jgi:two-component system, sensor histidine kinase PdtaS
MEGLLAAVGVPVWVVEPERGAGVNGFRVIPGLSPAARVITANPAALTLHGAVDLGQLLARLDEVFPAEGRGALDAAWRSLDRGAPTTEAETVLATLAGRRLVAHVTLARSDGGRAVLTVRERSDLGEGVGIDVYRRLAESEARFRTMADCAPVMLWMASTAARCEFFNRGWLEFTGRSIEQEIGPGWAEGVHPEDFQRCMEIFLAGFVMRQSFSMEYRLARHDGEYRWILDQGVPRFAPDGSFAGFIGSCIDITPLKTLQHELDARITELGQRLREREVLLQEVHHRVKNNLQLVSSLLRMQAREVGDTRIVAVLEECQSRVHSIAAIHDGLYLSADFARVALGGYAHSLVLRIIQATGVSPAQVTVDVDVDDAEIGVDRAIPCGLLVNELVTNAFKHAFPDGRTGTVHVGVHAVAPGEIELVVSDDGIGMPADIAPDEAQSLGLRLVSILVEQLEASITLDRSPGTRFAIRFRSMT